MNGILLNSWENYAVEAKRLRGRPGKIALLHWGGYEDYGNMRMGAIDCPKRGIEENHWEGQNSSYIVM